MSFRKYRFLSNKRIRGRHIKGKLVWLGIILIAVAIGIDFKMRPIITAMSGYQVKTMITDLTNRAAASLFLDETYKSSDFVSLTLNDEGNIASIETNAASINLFQTELTQKIINALVSMDRNSVYVPLGTLLGYQFLSGRGPEIEIKIVPIGNVKAVTKSKFSSAGVNQTLHQITTEIDINAMAIIPGFSTEITVHTEYILAETMIVGTVPNTYAQIITQGESALSYLSDRS